MTRKHGLSSLFTAELKAWYSIIDRCLNPDSIHYKNYGARGITVCQEWVDDPEAFVRYMGPRPSDLHSVDRIENDKGYEPGNVKWSTRIEQNLNRRGTIEGVNTHGTSGLWYSRSPCHPITGRRKWLGKAHKTREAAVDAREAWLSVNWPDYPNGKPVTEW